MIRIVFLRKVDLDKVHFCKENKVKYRVHLTVGMVISSLCGVLALHYGVEWAGYVAHVFNVGTALIWIWE